MNVYRQATVDQWLAAMREDDRRLVEAECWHLIWSARRSSGGRQHGLQWQGGPITAQWTFQPRPSEEAMRNYKVSCRRLQNAVIRAVAARRVLPGLEQEERSAQSRRTFSTS